MQIYEPAEDSYLLSKTLKKYLKDKNVKNALEIGIGTGIQLLTLKKLGVKNIIGVDINSEAVKHCKKLGFNCFTSDLFSKVKGKFDLILFNPPYLPKTKYDKEADTSGGKAGSEVANKFLIQASKYLKDNGRVLLLVSSLTKGIKFIGYSKKIIAKKKLFFEELYVYEIWKKDLKIKKKEKH